MYVYYSLTTNTIHMKTSNGKKVSEKQIRLAASNFLFNDNLVKAYRKLVKKLNQGLKNDLATDYVDVPENLDATSVKQMVDMIESAIQPETSQDFFNNINWELLKEQKQYLLDTGIETETMDEIIAFFDTIQDYAVDSLGFDTNKVHKLSDY